MNCGRRRRICIPAGVFVGCPMSHPGLSRRLASECEDRMRAIACSDCGERAARRERGCHAGCGRLTIHCTPKRSAHMPKYGPQGALARGIATRPPALSAANTRSASALSLATIEM